MGTVPTWHLYANATGITDVAIVRIMLAPQALIALDAGYRGAQLSLARCP